jgi:hypothetical protein
MLTSVKSFRKRVADYWTPKKDAAHKTWKMLCDAYNEMDKPAAQAESTIKTAILHFDQEQERIRLELQQKAQEEADRLAEEQRAALAAQAEVEGATEDEIEQIISAPSVAVAEVVEPTYQRASSVSKRDNWKCRVNSVKLLCKAIGAGKLKFSPEDEKKIAAFFEGVLQARARADKSTLCIPGCEAWNDQIISGRIG